MPLLRPPELPLIITSKEPPAFSGFSATPALRRDTSTVKEKWLSSSVSLPDLRRKAGGAHSDGGAASTGAGGRETAEQLSVPPLLWLMGEDSVSPEALYRVCNRSMLILKVR